MRNVECGISVHPMFFVPHSEFRIGIMSYQITEKCTDCGDCLTVCPLDAISAGEKRPRIDPALCTDCGTCADICPARAIEGA
jgi:heterodisulfide reductase subunit A-like polyferredoxin